MSDSPASVSGGKKQHSSADHDHAKTTAAFAPNNFTSSYRQRSTILLHQKSPLLLATPPQVTRALAYNHAFIVPLNKIAGLLTWTTGDPWESFLLIAAFWFSVLYGDAILSYAGPLILVAFLILGMYFRRYSPLSSTGWTGEKKQGKKGDSEGPVEHRKSLDEILGTLQAFTGRCNILLAPMLNLTDFLSTQQTATSATTKPALTTLFIRILLASPVWIVLASPPFRVITGKRIAFLVGTLILSWHSRPCRISRAILWRSRTVRHAASLITGLQFEPHVPQSPRSSRALFTQSNLTNLQGQKAKNQSIRFTFSIYENQRRWIGLGWTSNMVAYERTPWTDEHLNPADPPESFELPGIEGGHAQWQWVKGSEWKVETAQQQASKEGNVTHISKLEEQAWVYYDNKWLNGARGQDGWSKYTRRRKWVRDAELVDIEQETPTKPKVSPSTEKQAGPPADKQPDTQAASQDKATKKTDSTDTRPPLPSRPTHRKKESLVPSAALPIGATTTGFNATASMASSPESKSRRNPFSHSRDQSTISTSPNDPDRSRQVSSHRRGSGSVSSRHSRKAGSSSSAVFVSRGEGGPAGSMAGSLPRSERERMRDEGQDVFTPPEMLKEREADWGLGDDVAMDLG